MFSNMLEYLEHTAARVPEKVAFYDDQISFTFAQLHAAARRIGSHLLGTVPNALSPCCWMPAALGTRPLFSG